MRTHKPKLQKVNKVSLQDYIVLIHGHQAVKDLFGEDLYSMLKTIKTPQNQAAIPNTAAIQNRTAVVRTRYKPNKKKSTGVRK